LARAAVFSEGAGGGIGAGEGEGDGVGVGPEPVGAPVAEEGPLPPQALSTIPAAIIRLSRRDIPVIVDPLHYPAQAFSILIPLP
jgi:hypothetical protein